jgi:hypothetical protein
MNWTIFRGIHTWLILVCDQSLVAISATFVCKKEILGMLKFYMKTRDAVERLRTDKDGVVSVEYVIVAACIVGMVVAVFGGASTGVLGSALTGGIGKIAAAILAAV